ARIVLEVALLEVLEGLGDRGQGLGVRDQGLEVRDQEKAQEKIKPVPVSEPEPVPNVSSMPGDQILKIKSQWKQVLEKVKERSLFGFVSLHEGQPLRVNEKGKLVIAFKKGYAFHKERLEEAKNKQAVEEALAEVTGEEVRIECVVGEVEDPGPKVSVETVKEIFEGELIA
ncbi:hypothetical protein KKF55_06655, partial [Patescibacteria group bacterium]|nr:hypothetical protein [Patescibacteria group bacterium]